MSSRAAPRCSPGRVINAYRTRSRPTPRSITVARPPMTPVQLLITHTHPYIPVRGHLRVIGADPRRIGPGDTPPPGQRTPADSGLGRSAKAHRTWHECLPQREHDEFPAAAVPSLSLIHISEPTRRTPISY